MLAAACLDEDLFLYLLLSISFLSLSLPALPLSLCPFLLISAPISSRINGSSVCLLSFIYFFLDSARTRQFPARLPPIHPPLLSASLPRSLFFHALDVLLRLQIHRFPFNRVNEHPPSPVPPLPKGGSSCFRLMSSPDWQSRRRDRA